MPVKSGGKRRSSTAGKRRVTFRLDEPGASEVALAGDFNGWDQGKHPMKKGMEGVWEKIVMLAPGRYEYKFLVDGDWRNDPANQELTPNRFGTSNNVVNVKKS